MSLGSFFRKVFRKNVPSFKLEYSVGLDLAGDLINKSKTEFSDGIYRLNVGSKFVITFKAADESYAELLRIHLDSESIYDDQLRYFVVYSLFMKDIEFIGFNLFTMSAQRDISLWVENELDKETANAPLNEADLDYTKKMAVKGYIQNNKVPANIQRLIAAQYCIDKLHPNDYDKLFYLSSSQDPQEHIYYFRFLCTRTPINGYSLIQPDDFHFNKWQRALSQGLVESGYEIDAKVLANNLTLPVINEMFADRLDKKLSRRQQAIDFISQQPDFKDRFFATRPQKAFMRLNFEDYHAVSECFRLLLDVTDCILTTYFTAEKNINCGLSDKVESVCPSCKSKSNIRHSGIPPFYYGCGCRFERGY